MNVSLTPHFEKVIADALQSGRYNNASEVVREGLRLLEKVEFERVAQLESLRREIQIGLDQADRGEVVELDTALIEQIKRRGREQLELDRAASATDKTPAVEPVRP